MTLCNPFLDKERIKLHSLKLLGTRFRDDDFESTYNYLISSSINTLMEDEIEIVEDEDADEVDENQIYNGTNEIVKIFNQKCVICLDKDSVYAFRNCGHLCLCENCFDSRITKYIVCRCT